MFFFNDTATTEIYTLSLHDALPIYLRPLHGVLLGIDFLGILVAEGDLQPLQQVDEEHFAEQTRQAHDAASLPLSGETPKPGQIRRSLENWPLTVFIPKRLRSQRGLSL